MCLFQINLMGNLNNLIASQSHSVVLGLDSFIKFKLKLANPKATELRPIPTYR